MNSGVPDLTKAAIEAATNSDWNQAVDLNLHILQLESQNIPALNRLARAYENLGKLDLAKKTYQKVLKIDRYNSIANNNLDRIGKNTHSGPILPSKPRPQFSFIEEPGKTKTVVLTKLAPVQIISSLWSSQPLDFKASKRKISVVTEHGSVIGSLPDDLATHLINFLNLGYTYEAAVKNVNKNRVEIFIRETNRSAKLKGLPSFTSKDASQYYQFLPTEPILETPLELPEEDI